MKCKQNIQKNEGNQKYILYNITKYLACLPHQRHRGRVVRALGCWVEGRRLESRSGQKTGKLLLSTQQRMDTRLISEKVGWLCWGLTSQSTIFQSCRDEAIASWVINQYFRGVKCLAQGYNTAAVGFEPGPLIPESDTLPLSHCAPLISEKVKGAERRGFGPTFHLPCPRHDGALTPYCPNGH